MQKISSIHHFSLDTKQILESYELKRHACFWTYQPTNHWRNFYQSSTYISTEKTAYSIYSFLRYSIFWSPVSQISFKFGICTETENSINFHYRIKSEKINYQIFL